MGETLTIIFGVVSFTVVIMGPTIINRITKYKLELEKMRLEADVRKEEIRCRNQLELDKFINGGQAYESPAAAAKQNEDVDDRNLQDVAAGMFEGVRTGKQTENSGVPAEKNVRERLNY